MSSPDHPSPEHPYGPRHGVRHEDAIADAVLLAQGGYYAVTGLWPIVHMRSFEAVTGPKREHWLVHTVGALAFGVGATLATAALRRRVTPEVRLLATLAPLGFVAVEVPNVARGRISPVYLMDAIVEAGFAAVAARGGGEGRSGGSRYRPRRAYDGRGSNR